jgi:hypothetical protein
MGYVKLDSVFATANSNLEIHWWALTTHKPFVRWSYSDRLDLIVHGDVGKKELELLRGEEPARAVVTQRSAQNTVLEWASMLTKHVFHGRMPRRSSSWSQDLGLSCVVH